VRAEDDQALYDYVRALIELRADHAVFRRRRFFRGCRPAAAATGSATSPGSPWPARR
jgi:Type II secretory pathway, pullulanase PulA and related glycosidases